MEEAMDKKKHFYRVGTHSGGWDDLPVDSDVLDTLIYSARKHIEPWLSVVFQAEHLNLLLGSGFTTAVGTIAGVGATGMAKVTFGTTYYSAIDTHAQAGATAMKRGAANIEDQFRSALTLLDGLAVIDKGAEGTLKDAIDVQMSGFLTSLLKTESGILTGIDATSKDSAQGTLQSFLLSFASRAASRERLHVFTINYDRLIEHGCDFAGLRIIDRFVGALNPVFRASRVEVDVHYNPPGIRLLFVSAIDVEVANVLVIVQTPSCNRCLSPPLLTRDLEIGNANELLRECPNFLVLIFEPGKDEFLPLRVRIDHSVLAADDPR
jgi:hypothetical protein